MRTTNALAKDDDREEDGENRRHAAERTRDIWTQQTREASAVIPCVTQTKAEAQDELVTLPGVTPEWIEMRLGALPG